jgi:hypothetical protein
MSEQKLFGKYNDFILVLMGFLLTGVIGTFIAQTYTTKNAELSAANKIFSEYSKLAGDRYFTMNQVLIAIREGHSEEDLKFRWNEYRSELQKWNTARGYNREMIKLYFGQPLWNVERDVHYFFRAWGQSLEAAKKQQSAVDFACLDKKRDQFLVTLHSFNFSLGEAIQKGNIGSSKTNKVVDKSARPEGLCLATLSN